MKTGEDERKPLTILVIEDHPDQRDLLAIVLQREGYRVVTAGNGVEAMEALQKGRRPDRSVGHHDAQDGWL